MPTFYDLPLEMRLKIYTELEIPQFEPISLGKNFTAEAAYLYPPQILQISHQVSQEARMAFSATSKRPWKINVMASTDARLSLPDKLPDRLAHSAHIQFNLVFPDESDTTVTALPMTFDDLVQRQDEIAKEFEAIHQVWCGINEICRRLAEVSVKRDIEICFSGHGKITNWETKKTVLQPFCGLRNTCSFRLGKVSGWHDNSKQVLAGYLEVVTGRLTHSKRHP